MSPFSRFAHYFIAVARCGSLRRAAEQLEERRRARSDRLERLRAEAYAKEPRLERLDKQLQGTMSQLVAAALRQGREPTQAELAQLEAAFSRQGFTQGYFRDQKGPAMFGTRPQGARDPADLFDQARRFYTRGEHRTVPVSLTAQVQGEMPMVLTAPVPRPPAPARPRQTRWPAS